MSHRGPQILETGLRGSHLQLSTPGQLAAISTVRCSGSPIGAVELGIQATVAPFRDDLALLLIIARFHDQFLLVLGLDLQGCLWKVRTTSLVVPLHIFF